MMLLMGPSRNPGFRPAQIGLSMPFGSDFSLFPQRFQAETPVTSSPFLSCHALFSQPHTRCACAVRQLAARLVHHQAQEARDAAGVAQDTTRLGDVLVAEAQEEPGLTLGEDEVLADLATAFQSSRHGLK